MNILIVSDGGSIRSPLAAALIANAIPGATVSLASVRPSSIHPFAQEALQDLNLGGYEHNTIALTPEHLKVEYIILVSTQNPLVDVSFKARLVHWPLPDPLFPTTDNTELKKRVRDTRLALEQHVKQLARQLEAKIEFS